MQRGGEGKEVAAEPAPVVSAASPRPGQQSPAPRGRDEICNDVYLAIITDMMLK